jgi:hypothetical protein
MDENFTAELPEISFTKEIAKSFVISTAVTAGTVVGFIVVGVAWNKIDDVRAKRRAKKNPIVND